jgi:hypothetical protein
MLTNTWQRALSDRVDYGDFVELLVAPDIEDLQLSEVTSGG